MAMAVIVATHAAKLHVEEIKSNKFAIGKKEPNLLTQDLHHAVSSLSAELYTKDVHFFNGAYLGYCFFYSLPSNAEDNEYSTGVQPTPEFVLTTRDITKTSARSTLLVFNNEVGFSRKNMDPICSVGRSTKKGKRYIAPEWVEGTTIGSDLCEIYGANKILPSSTIVLPLKPEKVEATKAQLSKLHLEILLFLCKIKRLSVRVISNNPK
ncbi:hypothetical protein J1N35_004918 [Gossypium stocksii]|uniref:Uncharacterized protein n=1 Tax=Gossypium stocksii TaxID=47602 RepID=A0A9D4AIH4_9ROSI|nr:hypothetical protein J1N35_004918 [Gossypium stocksii]